MHPLLDTPSVHQLLSSGTLTHTPHTQTHYLIKHTIYHSFDIRDVVYKVIVDTGRAIGGQTSARHI